MAPETGENVARASKRETLGRAMKRLSKRSVRQGKALVSRMRSGSKRKPAVSGRRPAAVKEL
jgi:hypothetical protein